MTIDSAWMVQKAVYERLCAHSPLTLLLPEGAAGVHDHLPEDAGFPRVVFGEMEARPFGAQGEEGCDIAFTVLSQSRAQGMKQVKAVMKEIAAALHEQAFAVEGQHLILCRLESAAARLEGDGETRTGSQRFRIVTEPAD